MLYVHDSCECVAPAFLSSCWPYLFSCILHEYVQLLLLFKRSPCHSLHKCFVDLNVRDLCCNTSLFECSTNLLLKHAWFMCVCMLLNCKIWLVLAESTLLELYVSCYNFLYKCTFQKLNIQCTMARTMVFIVIINVVLSWTQVTTFSDGCK